jgi:uncharacterized membrane protein YeaQ/YmgE (transglycosylase-associated protein family)
VAGVSASARRAGSWQLADQDGNMGSILGIIIIGFVAGIIARILSPGPNNPTGFVLTTALGVAGAFLATYLGQMIGWYRPGQGAHLLGALVGAVIILFIWNRAGGSAHHLGSGSRAVAPILIGAVQKRDRRSPTGCKGALRRGLQWKLRRPSRLSPLLCIMWRGARAFG